MTRQEFWRLSYQARPYLSHLTVDELARRSQDIISNLTILTSEGKIGFELPDQDKVFPWMELWTHVMEEFSLREMGMPLNVLDPEVMPKPSAPTPAKGFLESRNLKKDFSRCLVKYGNRDWLTRTIETGEWRISPASYYSNSALNKARQDSELDLYLKIGCLKKTPKPVIEMDGEYYHVLKEVLPLRLRAATNYYLVSLARGIIYRMFDDFEADACLIIHDETEFAGRMFRAFSAVYSSWAGEYKAVHYIDPCAPQPPLDVYFVKHFRYSYQEETRFFWTPPPPGVTNLDRITVNLGPMSDICELLTLSVGNAS